MTPRKFALDDLPPRVRDHVVVDESGCWLWTGRLNRGGYGLIDYRVGPPEPVPAGRGSRGWGYGWKKWSVSRLTWWLLVAPVPEGMTIGHQCHDLDPTCAGGPTCLHRRCVNPTHLAIQSQQMNTAMAQRYPRPRNYEQRSNRERFTEDGVCAEGHEVTHPEQFYVYPDGRHMCRTCHYESRYGHPPKQPYGPEQGTI